MNTLTFKQILASKDYIVGNYRSESTVAVIAYERDENDWVVYAVEPIDENGLTPDELYSQLTEEEIKFKIIWKK